MQLTVRAIVHVAMAAVVTHKLGGTWCRSWWWNVQGQNVTMLVVDWFEQVVVMVDWQGQQLVIVITRDRVPPVIG